MTWNTGMETKVSLLKSGSGVALGLLTPYPPLCGGSSTPASDCIYGSTSSPSPYPHLHTLCVALTPPPLTVGLDTWLALANRMWHGTGLKSAPLCLRPLCASAERSPRPSSQGSHSQPTIRGHGWPDLCRRASSRRIPGLTSWIKVYCGSHRDPRQHLTQHWHGNRWLIHTLVLCSWERRYCHKHGKCTALVLRTAHG